LTKIYYSIQYALLHYIKTQHPQENRPLSSWVLVEVSWGFSSKLTSTPGKQFVASINLKHVPDQGIRSTAELGPG